MPRGITNARLETTQSRVQTLTEPEGEVTLVVHELRSIRQ